MKFFLKFDGGKLLSILLISPSIFLFFIGWFNINFPAKLITYAICILFLFIKISYDKKIFFCVNNKKIFFLWVLFILVLIYYTIFSVSKVASYTEFYSFLYLACVPILILYFWNVKNIESNYDNYIISVSRYSCFAVFFFVAIYLLGLTDNVGYSIVPKGMENQIWFSRFIADYIFIIIFCLFIYNKNKLLYIAAVISSLYLFYYSGSRAPVVSLFFVIFLFIFKCKRKLFLTFVLMFSPAILYLTVTALEAMYHFNTYSILERLSLYNEALELISNNWFGYGNSSFGILTLGIDKIWYPHNIILELLVNFGVFGLFIFIMGLYYVFKHFDFNNVFTYLYIMSVINSFSSGSLAGNSSIFVYGFLIIAMNNIGRNKFAINKK
ncbi:TPA: O-antigen ligase family protein [Photobacterium damselae]